eukprot:scaffold1401_cov330-Pavlova_lutheri.AAC.11
MAMKPFITGSIQEEWLEKGCPFGGQPEAFGTNGDHFLLQAIGWKQRGCVERGVVCGTSVEDDESLSGADEQAKTTREPGSGNKRHSDTRYLQCLVVCVATMAFHGTCSVPSSCLSRSIAVRSILHTVAHSDCASQGGAYQ